MQSVGLSAGRYACGLITGLTLLLTALLWNGPIAASGDQSLYIEDGVALAGYDPVAYHTMQEAVRGSDQYAVEWQGALWHFVSQDHADLFAAEPAKYQPRYGGFCAFGVSKGYRMTPDMTAWEVHDGQLYLYFDDETGKAWAEDRAVNTTKAEKNWPDGAAEIVETSP